MLLAACGGGGAAPDAGSCPAPQRVLLERNGGAFAPGPPDPAARTTPLVEVPVELEPDGYDDLRWTDLVVCVVGLLRPNGIEVAVVDDGRIDHLIAVTASAPEDLGFDPGQRAAYETRCDGPGPAVSFVFASPDPLSSCYAAAAAVAAAAGASPTGDCLDVMSPSAGSCGPPAFSVDEVACAPAPCACTGRATQSSAAVVTDAYACATAGN